MTFKGIMKAPNEVITFDDPLIRYPMYESRKYDGFRMLAMRGSAWLTSKVNEHANQNIPQHFFDFAQFLAAYNLVADGELWSPSISFSLLSGLLRSHMAPLDNVEFYVFDLIEGTQWDKGVITPYEARNALLHNLVGSSFPHIHVVEQTLVNNAQEAQDVYNRRIELEQEGSMLRSTQGGYKHGRATHKESLLYKFKQFLTIDAKIIEVIQQERMVDGLDRTLDNQGFLKRTYRKEDYVPTEMIAGFTVQLEDGTTCGVKTGKGHDHMTKMQWYREWRAGRTFLGEHVEFKYMPHGMKDRPRIGTLVRFRPDL